MIFKSPRLKEIEYTKFLQSLVRELFRKQRAIIKRKNITRFTDSAIEEVEAVTSSLLKSTFNDDEVESFIATFFDMLYIMLDRRLQAGLNVSVGLKNKELIELIISQNITLAKSLQSDIVKDVERVITQGIIEGETIRSMTTQISDMQNKGLHRAETIAVTEVAKASSQINRSRFKELGITKAKWSASADKRTRKCHRDRDGKEYDLEKGLEIGCDNKALQVGQEIRCRCAMVVVL